MTFNSILFKIDEKFDDSNPQPEFFEDLNLNVVVEEITKEKEAYNLKPFFYHSLKNIDNVVFRQEIMKNIEQEDVFKAIKSFASSMLLVAEGIKKSESLSCIHQKERWHLDSVYLYCQSVEQLYDSLCKLPLSAEGFLLFLSYLKSYTSSEEFKTMYEHSKRLKDELNKIRYTLFIKENKIRVERYKNEDNYADEILAVFERFRQNEVEDYEYKFHDTEYANHIESEILKSVAKLNQPLFDDLREFADGYENFQDELIKRFDREIEFYISYLEYIKKIESFGLKFCYPSVNKDKNDIHNIEGFDIALAYKLANENKTAVSNDFYLKNGERIFIVTGPNQGGKTTFARAFAQMHYLAKLGLKTPGSEAKLLFFDNMFTHFEIEEKIETLIGKLESDLIRVKDIMQKASPQSIIVMNEIFSSTSLQDAIFLAKQVLKSVLETDCLCVFVTFLDELASMSNKIVSMVSTVREDDVSVRTYKIVRKKADGVSYAISVAQKHCLNYECLSKRLKRIEK